MAVDPLQVRIARLEGSYEQIDKRLSSLETYMRTEFASLRADIRGEIGALRGEMRQDMRRLDGRVDLLLYGVIASVLVPILLRVFFPH